MNFNKIALVSSLVISGITVSSAFASKAAASVLITAQETGANVVFNYSGSLNTTGLTFNGSQSSTIQISPALGFFASLPTLTSASVKAFTGPTSFGTGGFTNASSSTGDVFAFYAYYQDLYFPNNYTSGSALSGSLTFDNTTLTGLGVTPGTYTWNLTNGLDSFTLTTVPEPLTILGSIAGLAFLGKTASIRKRKKLAE